MQIFKTSKAQTIDSGYEPNGAKNAELTDGAEGFFDQDYDSQEPVIPSNPFDALFIGQPQGTTQADGSPAANPFSVDRIVTVEQWLIANPEGIFHLDWYKETMEKILAKSIQKRDQMREALDNGKVPPQLVPQFLKWLEDSEPYHLALQQEIEKAANLSEEQNKVYFREMGLLQDINLDGYIGDRNSEDYYIVATRSDGTQVILEKDGKTPAANPTLDPNYKPALFKDDGSLRQIDRELLDKQPLGEDGLTFDEGFEVTGNTNAYADHFLNAGIDLTAAEGVWVEKGENGKPLVKNDHYVPKSLQLMVREDGTKMFGQEPPTDEERDRWVFVKATDLEISTEQVRHIKDSEGNLVDGGFVHIVFKDAEGKPLMRIRVQGREMPSYSSLVSDGTRYLAASTIGIAVNDGSYTNENGEKVYTEHSSRISYLNLDASRYESTGKTLAANSNDLDSIRQYYEALGIPVQIDDQGRFIGFSHSQKYSNDDESREDANLRAFNAANETLVGAFVDPAQLYPGNKPSDKEAIKIAWEIKKRFDWDSNAKTLTAYLPPGERYNENKTGIFVHGIRGVIRGAEKRNNIIIVDPPNDEAIKKMLPYAAEEIDPSSPAYGTVVYGGEGGYNIVVSKGGDAFVKDASFFWRENDPGRSDDQIYLDVSDINKEDYEHNKKVFAHIENAALIKIDNGDDLNDDDAAKELDKNHAPKDAKADLDAYAAKDDWFEVPNITVFGADANDLPGGLGSANIDEDGLANGLDTVFGDAETKLNSDIIRKDPLSKEYFEDMGEWALPVDKEDKARDAFFEEWEFFNDQEPSLDLEEKEKSKL